MPPSTTSGPSVDTLKQRRDLLENRRELQGLRRKLEKAERSLESLTRVLSLVPDPIEVVSADHSILFANHASHLLHGESKLEGTFYYRSVMGLEEPPAECPIRTAIAEGCESAYTATSETGEAYVVTVTPIELSDGRRAAMCISRAAATEDNRSDEAPPAADGGVPGSSGADSSGEDAALLRDIAELATRTLDVVLANVTDGVMIANTSGEVILCNRAFRELTGCTGSGPAELARILFPDRPSAESMLADLGRSDVPHQAETAILPPGGERIPVEMTAVRIDGIGDSNGLLVTLRDLRETRDIQDQLIKALSLSLAGERIASLAHQVNNYLTPAFYHAEILAQRDDLDRKTRQSVTTIQNYLNLCHESTLMVLSLIRPAVPTPIDVNGLVSEVFSRHYLAEELRLDSIEIVQKYDSGVAPTVGYRELLQQALVNVIRNAQQAMVQAHGKGQLTVSTEAEADTITIRIADDGPGIPEEIKDKIFDLMFTSKPLGKGSGIGLHFAKEVIARHGGTIGVESPPGRGATFEIRLPVQRPENPGYAGAVAGARGSELAALLKETTANTPGRAGRKPEIPARVSDSSVRSGRILIIDDEPGILELLSDILSEKRHEVTKTANAQDALRRIESDAYDCVICDIRMPEMDGRELSRRIKERKPGLYERLVFVTGDIFSDDTDTFLHQTGIPCIEKPFSADRVLDVVQGVLARPPRSETNAAGVP